MVWQYGWRLQPSSGLWRGRNIEFFLIHYDGSGKEILLRPNKDGSWETPTDLTKPESIGINLPSSFSLDPQSTQDLFDGLYSIGFRPTKPIHDDANVNRHLEDMRAIAFAKLGIEKPNTRS